MRMADIFILQTRKEHVLPNVDKQINHSHMTKSAGVYVLQGFLVTTTKAIAYQSVQKDIVGIPSSGLANTSVKTSHAKHVILQQSSVYPAMQINFFMKDLAFHHVLNHSTVLYRLKLV